MPQDQIGQAFDNVREDLAKRMASTRFAARNYRARAEQHMKAHAPWQDRTGDARRSLTATLEVDDAGIGSLLGTAGVGGRGGLPGPGLLTADRVLSMTLTLSHGVSYGVFLEFHFGGNYAILGPTAALFEDRIRDRLRAIWRGTGMGTGAISEIDAQSAYDAAAEAGAL